MIVHAEEVNAAVLDFTGGLLSLNDVLVITGALLLLLLGPIGIVLGLLVLIGWAIWKLADDWEQSWADIKVLSEEILIWFEDLGNQFWDLGANVVNNFIEGFANAWEGAKSGFGDMVDGIVKFFPLSPAKEGPLREHPPELWGSNIVRMLGDGLESQLPETLAVASTVAHELTNTFATSDVPLFEDGGTTLGTDFLSTIPEAIPQLPDVLGVRSTPETFAALPTLTATEEAVTQPAAQNQPTAPVSINVQMGDFNFAPATLSATEARSFMRTISEEMGDLIEAEMRRRNIL